MTKYIDVLRKSPLFSGLSIEEIFTFICNCDYSIREYSVCDNVDILNGYVILLIKGVVRSMYVDENGNSSDTNIFHYLDENIIMNGAFDNKFQEIFIALEPTVVMYVSYESLLENSASINITNVVCKNIIKSFTFAVQKAKVVSIFNVQKSVKTAAELYVDYQLYPPKGTKPFTLTKREAADMLKVDYTSLCREIRKMEKSNPAVKNCFSKSRKVMSINKLFKKN